MPLNRDRPTRAPRFERTLLTLVLGLGCAWSVYALAEGVTRRESLANSIGPWSWALILGLALSVLVGLLALARLALSRPTTARTIPAGWPRDLFCILVLGAVLYVAFVQPFDIRTFLWTLGLCGGLFAARVLAGSRHLPRVAAMLLFNLCFLLVLTELGLRTYGWLSQSVLLSPSDAGIVERIENNRLVPGTLRWGFPANPTGHYDGPFLSRAQRLDPTTTIAMLGDSFSVGIVPHALHFSTVCERLLEATQVYNFGVGSIGPIHYEHLLRTEVMPLQPDAVVLNLFVGNDLTRYVEGKPGGLHDWLDRDNVRLAFVPQRVAILMRERLAQDGSAANIAAPQGESTSVEADNGDPDALLQKFPWLADTKLEQPTFSVEPFLETETRRALSVCGPGSEGFPQLLAIVSRMKALVPEVPFAVVLIPDEFQVEDELWNTVAARASAPLQRDRPQRLLVPALQQLGIPVLDLLPILLAEPSQPDGARHLYHLRDTHFNARGNHLAGEAMARFLRPLLR